MADDLTKQVTEWLNGQGFPLEMTVAAAFRQAGFWVIQSDYYADPVTGTQREMDVVARLQMVIGADLARVTFVIECKVSKDRPWVMFTAESVRLADRARIVQRTASALGRQFLNRLRDEEEIRELPFFTLPKRAGYGLVQAMRKPDAKDLSYEALTAVSAASAAQAQEADDATNEGQGNFVEVIFPLVIVDGRLFEAYLDEANELKIEETTRGTLVWRNPAAGSVHSIITIATLAALNDVVAAALQTAQTLLSQKQAVTRAVLNSPE
jgi:hypothetical protein